MEDYDEVRFEHDADIECLTAEKISAVDIHRRVQTVCGDKCVDLGTVGAGCSTLSKTSWGKLGRKKNMFLRTEFKNLLNVGRSVLKTESVMWKNDYAQL